MHMVPGSVCTDTWNAEAAYLAGVAQVKNSICRHIKVAVRSLAGIQHPLLQRGPQRVQCRVHGPSTDSTTMHSMGGTCAQMALSARLVSSLPGRVHCEWQASCTVPADHIICTFGHGWRGSHAW